MTITATPLYIKFIQTFNTKAVDSYEITETFENINSNSAVVVDRNVGVKFSIGGLSKGYTVDDITLTTGSNIILSMKNKVISNITEKENFGPIITAAKKLDLTSMDNIIKNINFTSIFTEASKTEEDTMDAVLTFLINTLRVISTDAGLDDQKLLTAIRSEALANAIAIGDEEGLLALKLLKIYNNIAGFEKLNSNDYDLMLSILLNETFETKKDIIAAIENPAPAQLYSALANTSDASKSTFFTNALEIIGLINQDAVTTQKEAVRTQLVTAMNLGTIDNLTLFTLLDQIDSTPNTVTIDVTLTDKSDITNQATFSVNITKSTGELSLTTIDSQTVKVGETKIIPVTTTPSDAVIYAASGDANVVTATVNGSNIILRGISLSATPIDISVLASKAYYTDASTTFTVTVEKGDIVIGSIPDHSLSKGGIEQFSINVTPNDATIVAESDNTEIATAEMSGKTLRITGVSSGTAIVTVTATRDQYNEGKMSFAVTVTESDNGIPPSIISFNGNDVFSSTITEVFTNLTQNSSVVIDKASEATITINGLDTTLTGLRLDSGINSIYTIKDYTISYDSLSELDIETLFNAAKAVDADSRNKLISDINFTELLLIAKKLDTSIKNQIYTIMADTLITVLADSGIDYEAAIEAVFTEEVKSHLENDEKAILQEITQGTKSFKDLNYLDIVKRISSLDETTKIAAFDSINFTGLYNSVFGASSETKYTLYTNILETINLLYGTGIRQDVINALHLDKQVVFAILDQLDGKDSKVVVQVSLTDYLDSTKHSYYTVILTEMPVVVSKTITINLGSNIDIAIDYQSGDTIYDVLDRVVQALSKTGITTLGDVKEKLKLITNDNVSISEIKGFLESVAKLENITISDVKALASKVITLDEFDKSEITQIINKLATADIEGVEITGLTELLGDNLSLDTLTKEQLKTLLTSILLLNTDEANSIIDLANSILPLDEQQITYISKMIDYAAILSYMDSAVGYSFADLLEIYNTNTVEQRTALIKAKLEVLNEKLNNKLAQVTITKGNEEYSGVDEIASFLSNFLIDLDKQIETTFYVNTYDALLKDGETLNVSLGSKDVSITRSLDGKTFTFKIGSIEIGTVAIDENNQTITMTILGKTISVTNTITQQK